MRYFEKIFLEADTWSAFPVFNFGAHARDAKRDELNARDMSRFAINEKSFRLRER